MIISMENKSKYRKTCSIATKKLKLSQETLSEKISFMALWFMAYFADNLFVLTDLNFAFLNFKKVSIMKVN